MNSASIESLDEVGGYDCPEERKREPLCERVSAVAARKFTSRERTSRHSRFSRRTAPQRMSGSHRRGNKQYGI